MSEMPLKQIIDSALSKIGDVVDVNTVIGDPIKISDTVTVVPFSKVTVGFASGGTEFCPKNPRSDGNPNFAGGNGAGVSMTPLGFIVIENTGVRVIELGNPATYSRPTDPVNQVLDGVNGVIDKAPEIVDKLMGIFGKPKDDTPIDIDEVE